MSVRPLSLAALFLAFFMAVPLSAQADDAKKEKLARELMVLTGAGDLGKQVIEGMTAQLGSNKEMKPFLDKFVELADTDELVNLVIPLYVKAYDQETLEAAIEFYKSEAGRKLIAATPMLTQESMVIGQKWGMELAQKAQAALEADKAAK